MRKRKRGQCAREPAASQGLAQIASALLVAAPLVLSRMRDNFGSDRALDLRGLGLISAGAFGIVWGLVTWLLQHQGRGRWHTSSSTRPTGGPLAPSTASCSAGGLSWSR